LQTYNISLCIRSTVVEAPSRPFNLLVCFEKFDVVR
jgi:hypothetical protein